MRRHWQAYTIRDAIWHVRDAWKEVTEYCIYGAWEKLSPELAVDFRGFYLSERLSEECLELARRVGLDEIKEQDIDSLLETIGEELNELEKQRRQLEEEVEAEQHPMAPSMTKQLTVKILQLFYGLINQAMEEVDPDVERVGLSRRRMMSDLAHYEHLYEKGSNAGYS